MGKRLLLKTSLLLIFFFSLSGCVESGITITVLDAETKEPVEGAVYIAFWNVRKGIGYTVTRTEKIVEGVTDKDGKFHIPYVTGRIALVEPKLKIYKPSYVGWDKDWIYQGHYRDDITTVKRVLRNDFKWKDQTVLLERFPQEYSHNSHLGFLDEGLPQEAYSAEKGAYKTFVNIIESEVPAATEERRKLRASQSSGSL